MYLGRSNVIVQSQSADALFCLLPGLKKWRIFQIEPGHSLSLSPTPSFLWQVSPSTWASRLERLHRPTSSSRGTTIPIPYGHSPKSIDRIPLSVKWRPFEASESGLPRWKRAILPKETGGGQGLNLPWHCAQNEVIFVIFSVPYCHSHWHYKLLGN